MTPQQQRDLLTTFCNNVRDALLSHADQWPEEWDGFELRWLAREAFEFEAPDRTPERRKRFRDFRTYWTNLNLY